ncbi:MAG TPA: hypothetical protein VGD91_00735 [Trebonia sp.]
MWITARNGASAGQWQVPDAVLGHQVPGYLPAEAAGASGDQHRAVRIGQQRAG